MIVLEILKLNKLNNNDNNNNNNNGINETGVGGAGKKVSFGRRFDVLQEPKCKGGEEARVLLQRFDRFNCS